MTQDLIWTFDTEICDLTQTCNKGFVHITTTSLFANQGRKDCQKVGTIDAGKKCLNGPVPQRKCSSLSIREFLIQLDKYTILVEIN